VTALSPKNGGTPPHAATADFDTRVDRLFASAMEHQLEEQRTLTRLASRVEKALDELQRGIDSLSQHVSAAAAQAPTDAADQPVLEMLTRLAEDGGRQRAEVSESLGQLRDQLDLSGLHSELAELTARIEQSTTPLPAALSEVRTILSDLQARVERNTHPQADLASLLASFSEQLEARLSGDQDEATRTLKSAQRALSEQAVRLETLRETLQAQVGHAGDRVAALLDHATANQRELLATLGSTATQLAAEASFTREAVRGESEQLRDTLAHAIAVAKAGLDQTVSAARTVNEHITASGVASREAVERMQSLVEALVARLEEAQAQGAHRLSQAAAVLEQAAEGLEPSVLAAVADLRQALLDTAAADRAQSKSTAATLRTIATGTVDELRGLIEDVSQRMLEAQAGGTTELTEAAAGLVRAAEDLQPTFSSALAKLYGAVAAAATQVRATSEEAAARAEAALVEALREMDATISNRLTESEIASAQAARTLVEAQEQAASRLGQAAEMLEEQGAALRPALAEAAEELRQSLLEATAEDRIRAEASLSAVHRAIESAAGAMGEAVDAASDHLSTAVREAADRVAEQQSMDTTMLSDAAENVARTAESLAPAVAAALAEVDGTVTEAVTLVETALGERLAQFETAAQVAAEDLHAAASDAQDRLRVWLAGALPDAVAQMTSDLSEQLERLDARVDETVTKVETVWSEAGGSLQTTADAASTRMTEAARALTAVAGDNVNAAERRLERLTHQLDVLVERLDAVADAEGRRADAVDEILALVRRASGELQPASEVERAPAHSVVDLSPRAEHALALVTERFEAVLAEIRDLQVDGNLAARHDDEWDPDPARSPDVDTVALALEDTLERAQDLEHRLSEGIEDAVLRLDQACGSLSRLESQMVTYLRERDRAIAQEREQLVADLAERVESAAGRKDGSRLLGGLLQGSGRRRDPEPPPLSSPLRPTPTRSPQQAVRPPESITPGQQPP
jgi:hypothetical protein